MSGKKKTSKKKSAPKFKRVQTMSVSEMVMEIHTIAGTVEWTPEQKIAIDRIQEIGRDIHNRASRMENAFAQFKGYDA
jgi:hypothetical protein